MDATRENPESLSAPRHDVLRRAVSALRAVFGRSRATSAAMAAIIAAMAAFISTAGLRWSLDFHPDEQTIVRWIDQTRDHGHITERAYPGGWFELFRLRLWAERKIEKAERDWRSHYVQDCAVSAVNPRSFSPKPVNPHTEPADHTVQDGRDFNAFLYVVSALLLYAACLEAGLRPVAAVLSAMFFFASPAPHEFTRYCETDAALVASLCLFAWTTARALRRSSPTLVLMSGFVAGFATACKFTLAALPLWCLVLPSFFALRVFRGGFARRAGLAAALCTGALLCAAAGYAVGTPALVHDPNWYFQSLRDVSRGTYAEILANLGGVPSRWGAIVIRTRHLSRELAKIGVLPLAWGAFAWTFWWRRGLRRQAVGAVLLLPFFPFFAVLCCPFVRNQETLPFVVLLAMSGGVPLEWLLRRREKVARGTLPKPGAARLAVAALAASAGAAALADGAMRASAMISCFRQRDTQVEARNWLRTSMRPGLRIGLDAYATRCGGAIPGTPLDRGGLQFFLNERRHGIDFSHYVENVGFEARHPIRDPRTGALKSSVARNLAEWNGGATFPIAEWSVGPGDGHPTFAQQTIRLHSFSLPQNCAFDVPIGYARPISILPDGVGLCDFKGVPGLGALPAIHVVGKRGDIYCRPDFGDRALVTLMPEGTGSARIVTEGLFHPASGTLPSGGAVAFELNPSHFERIAAKAMARPRTRVRMRGDDQSQFCVAFFADTVEAARQLRAAGSPEAALRLLEDCGANDVAARVEAFMAASACGSIIRPEWRRAAEDAVAAADRLREEQSRQRGGEVAGASLRGVPLDVAEDFCHVRIDAPHIIRTVALPVFLPPGRYGVSVRFPSGANPDPSMSTLLEGLDAPLVQTRFRDGSFRHVGTLSMRRMARPVFSAGPALSEPGEILSAEIDITWDPVQRTLAAADEIRQAIEKGASPTP